MSTSLALLRAKAGPTSLNLSGMARLRQIVISAVVGDSLGVSQGLTEGDRVVVNGQNNLRDSVAVTIVGEGNP